jgi:iron(III) transport system permease protein
MSNYTSLSTVTDLSSAAKNSLLVGVVTATAVTVIAAAASWFITRARVRGGGGLDSLAFLPIVMPGLILGLATSFIFLHVAQPVYGTVWIFIFALSSRYLPYGMRFSNAAMSQVSRELEEAAGTSGASALQSFRRVMLPLVSGGLVAGWMFVFIFAFRELSAALLLYSPNTQVVPVVMWHLATEGGFGPLAALGLLMVVGVALIVACVYRLGSRLGAIEPQ